MSDQNKRNPYYLDRGYNNRHALAITGYGITIDSIKYWLYNHDLAVDTLNDFIDASDLNDYLAQQNPDSDVTYVTTTNTDFNALMTYTSQPQVDPTIVKSINQINVEITKAIEDLYNVPIRFHNKLANFVYQYASYINVCDVD